MKKMHTVLKMLSLSILLAFTVSPTPLLALDTDTYKKRIGKVAGDLPKTVLKRQGVPGPILDIFFGTKGGAKPIDYARITDIVADEVARGVRAVAQDLDVHDFEETMKRSKETLTSAQHDLANYSQNWSDTAPEKRGGLSTVLIDIFRDLGKVNDEVLGNYPKKGFPLFAAVATLRLGIIAMAAQEYDSSSNFSFRQLQNESTRLLTTLFEEDLLWDEDPGGACYREGYYCATLATEISIAWRKTALAASAAQRMPSAPGGEVVSDFSLVNKTEENLIIKWHSYSDPEASGEMSMNWFEVVGRYSRRYATWNNPPTYDNGPDPGEGWYSLGTYYHETQYRLPYYKDPEGGDQSVIPSFAAIRRAFSFPLPSATIEMGPVDKIVPLSPGDTWNLPSRSYPYTTSSWFGVYLQSDAKPGVRCLDAHTSEFVLNNPFVRFGGPPHPKWHGYGEEDMKLIAGQRWLEKNSPEQRYLMMELPVDRHRWQDVFGCNAKLLGNFQVKEGGLINIVSTNSSVIAKQAPHWARDDPKVTRYKIGTSPEGDDYILHEDGSYSQKMSHAACKAKCEANLECVMIRVNTANNQDCLMGSSVGKASLGDVDANVTSMRIISRTGNYVLESSY